MNEILTLKRNAVMLGLCDEYKAKWDEVTDKRELVDVGLDANGVDFLCASCSGGWGLTTGFIRENFAGFINGHYTRNKDGYTSELYVGYRGAILQSSTITTVLGGQIEIMIPKINICKIYVAAGSDVTIKCDGVCELYVYGDTNTINITGRGRVSRHDMTNEKTRYTWARFASGLTPENTEA